MNRNRRTLIPAAAVLAAMSCGMSPQALAALEAPPVSDANAASTVSALPAASPAATAAGYLKQWMFDPNHAHHPLYAKSSWNGPSRKNTNLKNKYEHRFLQHERQTFGINLGWTDDASPRTAEAVSRWFFTRPDTTRPLRYGDRIAIGNGANPSYIRYANRTFGINLDWSRTPRYEWKLLGGKIGTQVRSGDWLAIYNTVTRQPLISFDRTVGADIGWPDSETWGEQVRDAVLKYIKDHWAEGVAYLITLA